MPVCFIADETLSQVIAITCSRKRNSVELMTGLPVIATSCPSNVLLPPIFFTSLCQWQIMNCIVLYLSISIALLTAWAFQKRSRPQQLILCRGLHAKALQTTASEGLAQSPYVADRAGFEPATLSIVHTVQYPTHSVGLHRFRCILVWMIIACIAAYRPEVHNLFGPRAAVYYFTALDCRRQNYYLNFR